MNIRLSWWFKPNLSQPSLNAYRLPACCCDGWIFFLCLLMQIIFGDVAEKSEKGPSFLVRAAGMFSSLNRFMKAISKWSSDVSSAWYITKPCCICNMLHCLPILSRIADTCPTMSRLLCFTWWHCIPNCRAWVSSSLFFSQSHHM